MFSFWTNRIKNIKKIVTNHGEIIPLLVFVSSGVCIAGGMFLHKMISNPSFQFDKSRRMSVLKNN